MHVAEHHRDKKKAHCKRKREKREVELRGVLEIWRKALTQNDRYVPKQVTGIKKRTVAVEGSPQHDFLFSVDSAYHC